MCDASGFCYGRKEAVRNKKYQIDLVCFCYVQSILISANYDVMFVIMEFI